MTGRRTLASALLVAVLGGACGSVSPTTATPSTHPAGGFGWGTAPLLPPFDMTWTADAGC